MPDRKRKAKRKFWCIVDASDPDGWYTWTLTIDYCTAQENLCSVREMQKEPAVRIARVEIREVDTDA